MTAEEFIALVQESAGAFVPEQAARFAEAARQDLAYVRGEIEGGIEVEFEEDYEPPRLPNPPRKYRNSTELWMTFSTFIAHFVDPIAAAVTVAQFAQGTEGMPDHLVATAVEEGADPANEIDTFDLDRLKRDYQALLGLADELGREAFGDRFSIRDFIGSEEER